jgi:hypothetical protein
MVDTHVFIVPTNPLDTAVTTGKNLDEIDAGLEQNQSSQRANGNSHVDMESNIDLLPTFSDVAGSNPEAYPPTPHQQDTTVPHERELASTRHVSGSVPAPGATRGSSMANSREVEPSLAGESVGFSVPAQETSSGSTAHASSVAWSAPLRPNTHLQHGIQKPKIYTVGTI